MKSAWRDTTAFITKDGSTIRELMHPAIHGNRRQSLAETANATTQPSRRTSAVSRASGSSRGPRLISVAEATVAPGASTHLHRHRTTEEIYHFTAGSGRMHLGDQEFPVTAGETANAPSLARGPIGDVQDARMPRRPGMAESGLDPIVDTVCIPPGTAHRLHNTGQEPLRLLCSCSPPYSETADAPSLAHGPRLDPIADADTELL